MLDRNERVKLSEMMYSWGFEDADEIVETLIKISCISARKDEALAKNSASLY
jgi:hypothetical protein